MKRRYAASLFLALLLVVTCSLTTFADNKSLTVFSNSSANINKLLVPETSDKGDEAVVAADMNTGWDKAHEQLATLRAASTPNTVQRIRTVAPGSITKLEVKADLCAILIEPTDAQSFDVSYVGVKDISLFPVEVSTKDSTLTVEVTGKSGQLHYLSTQQDNLVNVVRIQVPANRINDIQLSNETGINLIQNLDVPLNGYTVNGILRTVGDSRTKEITMESTNGSLYVDCREITGNVALKTVNGNADVETKTLRADKVTMDAVNGRLELEADVVKNATLKVVNGNIDVEVGTIETNLKASATNGNVEVSLKKKPTNLTLKVNRGNSKIDLPTGWSNGYSVGNGVPVLDLSVTNGKLELELDD